jgi:hypothetical protein
MNGPSVTINRAQKRATIVIPLQRHVHPSRRAGPWSSQLHEGSKRAPKPTLDARFGSPRMCCSIPLTRRERAKKVLRRLMANHRELSLEHVIHASD